ncbi:hypothetical protein J3B01_002262 [Coemansia erecta]|nr:hypothetical protein J3B01_002262 [Coemansia erecta]
MVETSDSDPMDVNGTSSDPMDVNGVSSGSKSEATQTESTPAVSNSMSKKPPAKCQACTTCRQKKVRCDGVKPICSACARSGTECLYVPSRRRGRPARASRGYERPYANPQPILPRQPRSASVAVLPGSRDQSKYQPVIQQVPPNRVLPTLPHLQPAQSGQGTMPPPQPTAPPRTGSMTGLLPPILPPQPLINAPQQQSSHPKNSLHQRLHDSPQKQQHNHQGIAPLGSILAAALFPGSPHSTSEDDGGHSGHRSSGSESPLPLNVRPPPFLVPSGERGGHQTMARATPLVIPRPSQMPTGPAGSSVGSSYMDPNIVEFFHYFNALFPIVHWPSFKEAYDDGTVPNYLILAIRALSKRYSKQPSVVLSGQLYAAGQDLAAIATSLAEAATREDPNTYLIQTWIVLSMFEFGMGRLVQAADRRELAVRLAYQLELSHIEVRASQRRARSLIVAENCRRVWWTLFYADRYFSLVSSDPQVSPAIHESTYRVGFPRTMREATPPPPLQRPGDSSGNVRTDGEFPRYNDHDVILWFQSAIPLSLLMGHLAHQCRAAEQLFRGGLAERSTDALWEDAEWLAALSEFVKSFLVIDAELAQWRLQLNAACTMSSSLPSSSEAARSNTSPGNAHSTRDVTLFHRELQYHGLVIIHQCLALYAYEKLRLNISVLSSICTSLLWLESTATLAWRKVVRSADIIRTRTHARASELANARASATGTMPDGAAPEPEWELCAPHMPFILYLSAKVHVCQYHWQKIALARTRAEARNAYERQNEPGSYSHHAAAVEPQVTPSFVQPFSQPPSGMGTPTAAQDGWAPAPHGDGQSGQHFGTHLSSMPDGPALQREAAGTPVMTTSGAAALAAAQAAAAAAVAHSNSSRNTTPQRSRGGSISHLHTPGGPEQQQPTSASTTAGSDYNRMDESLDTDTNARQQAHQRRHRGSDDSIQMHIDAADVLNDDGEDIESKLVRRVASSQERLENLLRLLATCQEYWADHDYVQMLRSMLDWPDEWTTSMHMLEHLLLELRID